ncbi:stage II sporulation protein M [Methylomarinum vadi]|uniref:stage II sporulation protein M n=1 Tax=Methylomarinum vadi TaxID=438855 RepID=UPI0004DF95ED|nr:stage II sporulation protein M [Methylomarinum vadi]
MKSDHSQQALVHWLDSRRAQWQELEAKLNTAIPGNEVEDARKVINGFRSLIADLAMARQQLPHSPITRYLESLFIRSHEAIHRPPRRFLAHLTDLYCRQIPRLMRSMAPALLFTLLLFMLSVIAGWLLVRQQPELATLFASTEMINHVEAGKLWTDDLLNIMPSSVLSISIISNNITVSLFAFALGALYGLGTLYVILLNGLMLGGIFAFTARHQMDRALLEFIIAHSVVELSVIIISAAMGLRLGEALLRPGNRNRTEAFHAVTITAGRVMLAAVPFLILAGLIEGFISPDPRFDLGERLWVGGLSGTLFWSIMLFGFPSKPRRDKIALENGIQTAERSRNWR